jgi:hypothetical protein
MLRAMLLTLALVLSPTAALAGTVSIAPSNSAIMLGQSVTFTVSVDSTDPVSVNADSLFQVAVGIAATGGPTLGTASNFQLAAGLPTGTSFVGFGFVGAAVNLGTNNFSSFDGALYTVDFTPTAIGIYTLSSPANSSVAEYSGALDSLTLSQTVNVNVLPSQTAVPEPSGLVLAGAFLCGLVCCRRRCTRRLVSGT